MKTRSGQLTFCNADEEIMWSQGIDWLNCSRPARFRFLPIQLARAYSFSRHVRANLDHHRPLKTSPGQKCAAVSRFNLRLYLNISPKLSLVLHIENISLLPVHVPFTSWISPKFMLASCNYKFSFALTRFALCCVEERSAFCYRWNPIFVL